MIIYKATNTKNGKVYIGQTKQGLNRRIRGHVCAAKKQHNQNNHFLNAIRNYGSLREAARMLNIDSGSLSRHLKGQLSHVSGYTFIQIEV